METVFVLDIETTGFDFKADDILQIGMLACNFTPTRRLWEPVAEYELFLPTKKNPTCDFAKEHMAALYTKCQAVPYKFAPWEVRQNIMNWVHRQVPANSEGVKLMGWNIGVFDLRFLLEKGYAIEGDRNLGKPHSARDFHYRVFELGGAVDLITMEIGWDRSRLLEFIEENGVGRLPDNRKKHDALFDCYMNLRRVNGLHTLLRHFRAGILTDKSPAQVTQGFIKIKQN